MPQPVDEPFVDSILHPSNLTDASEHAFIHALAIALHGNTSLVILNAGERGRQDRWSRFPSVRGTLERWGLLENGTSKAAVARDLAVRVKKVSLNTRSPLPAVLDYLDEHAIDLIVLATEGRNGLPRWIKPSIAERLARQSKTLAMFVPGTVRGFVSPEDGGVSLRRVLVPIDHDPKPTMAVGWAAHATTLCPTTPLDISLLHVSGTGPVPDVNLPESKSCTWSHLQRDGDVVDAIVATAGDLRADLIVMATAGHDGVLDMLRGSVTEQVLRHAPCPVLAVPTS